MMRWLFALVLMAGCYVPAVVTPAPPSVPVDFGTLPDCPSITPVPTSEYVCGIKHTSVGLRCVACDVDVPCVYRKALVYCTPTCKDEACK